MGTLGDRVVGSVGEYLAEQRKQAKLSLRQLSAIAGVSNPYLSQIERGLRRPSAEVLQQLARALRISAETLYLRAGILDPDERGDSGRDSRAVVDAVLLDPALNERQKQVLLDVYESFVHENGLADRPASTQRSGKASSPRRPVPTRPAQPEQPEHDPARGAN